MILVILKTQPNHIMGVGLIFWAASQYSETHTVNSNVNNKKVRQFFRLEKILEQLNSCQFQVNNESRVRKITLFHNTIQSLKTLVISFLHRGQDRNLVVKYTRKTHTHKIINSEYLCNIVWCTNSCWSIYQAIIRIHSFCHFHSEFCPKTEAIFTKKNIMKITILL